jgi:hypothetical protein
MLFCYAINPIALPHAESQKSRGAKAVVLFWRLASVGFFFLCDGT